MRKWSGLLIGLTACSGAESWEGTWFVERPVLDLSACGESVDENYRDADPVTDDGDSGEWTITESSSMSAEALFVQVLAGRDGDVFVVVGDEVYPGTADRNMLTVTWTGEIDDHFVEEHEDGYRFAVDVTGTVEEQLMLARDKESGGVRGAWKVNSATTTAFSESDEWRANRVGISYSQIPSWGWLVGDRPENLPDTADCSGGECELSIGSTCDGSVDVTGRYAGTDGDGMYDGVEDAGQDPGTGAGGGYYGYY